MNFDLISLNAAKRAPQQMAARFSGVSTRHPSAPRSIHQAPVADSFQRTAPVGVKPDKLRFAGSAATTFSLSDEPWRQLVVPAVIAPVYQYEDVSQAPNVAGELNQALQGAVSFEGFTGKAGQVKVFQGGFPTGITSPRVMLVGLGDKEKITPDRMERIIATALGHESLEGKSGFSVVLPESTPKMPAKRAVKAIIDGVDRATYRTAEAHKPRKNYQRVEIAVQTPPGKPLTAQRKNELEQAVKTAEAISDAKSFAKDLANSPYNKLNVAGMRQKAEDLAAQYPDLSLEVKDHNWVKENMPAFFAVGQGSVHTDPPTFIKLTYKPSGGQPHKKLAVIGKSVMYDTGGVQGKGENMGNMSKDMTGGAYALGLMKALGELKPQNVEVTAYLAATPNDMDAASYRPDDILDSTVGKKIRIQHTDAEGRLTLIDGVTQAAKTNPDEIITIATLTGAAAMAVGKNVALMTRPEDAKLRDRIVATAQKAGEAFETLRVDDTDFEAISTKDDSTDIVNQVKGARGGQTAAAFVMSGLPEGSKIPLAHWDIAGVLAEGPGFSGPSTGIGLETLIQYVLKA